ncbi:protein RKD2-like [Cannabis sativa]|uniref:protein RKD2-like n=1 Tax=Cannabis sativa TaxID=3483 RepID=UPI0029C9E290|nr:protein RKD2-like [Cannabis sativa]
MCNDNIDRRESNYGDNHDGKGKDIIIKEERKVNNKRPYRSSSVLVISEEKSSSKRLSKEVLSKYYYMPITQAAKELNVGLTLLKKRCRELGIRRWPHRKLMSLQTLIKNVQDLRNGESNNEENDSRYKQYIELLEREKKLVEEVPDVELNEGTKRLRQACFKNNYKKRKMITTTTTTMDYCSTTDLEEEEDDEIKFLLSDSFSSSSMY